LGTMRTSKPGTKWPRDLPVAPGSRSPSAPWPPSFSLVVGIGIGTLAGFLGGLVDDFLMRIAEAVQTVPVFLLALAIVSVLGPTPQSVVIAIAVASWPAPARLVRA